MGQLEGKTIVVIGGGGGLGTAFCRGLAREGAYVVVADLDQTKAQETVRQVTEEGGRAQAAQVNALDRASLESLVNGVSRSRGTVDGLVNAAGTHLRKPSVEITEEEWDRVMSINLKAVFLACQVFGKAMIEQGHGAIVNIASMAAHVALDEALAYCASKGGVLMLTKALAREWAPHGVRVNAISPGFFLTPLNRDLLRPGSERRRRVEERTPMGRFGEPEELVGGLVYLLSDEASFVTGTTLIIDGGFLAEGV
ncbi:MAG: glucose 1-dehydrogenase [Candidatus Acetothermia bacterium]|jgi:gluconate 5-dehydrogenase/2-deoxy-D-gluconate 3-dehydrogenase|nr:glucose 1-dehydrogenase [Candidatus Acetothermia bacterium]